jgi:hypothetical protein
MQTFARMNLCCGFQQTGEYSVLIFNPLFLCSINDVLERFSSGAVGWGYRLRCRESRHGRRLRFDLPTTAPCPQVLHVLTYHLHLLQTGHEHTSLTVLP